VIVLIEIFFLIPVKVIKKFENWLIFDEVIGI